MVTSQMCLQMSDIWKSPCDFIVILFGDSSQLNSHDDFAMESPNDETRHKQTVTVISQEEWNKMLVHRSDCGTCDYLWRQSDIIFTGRAVGIGPIFSFATTDVYITFEYSLLTLLVFCFTA